MYINQKKSSLVISNVSLSTMPDLSFNKYLTYLKICKTNLTEIDGNKLPETLLTLICEDNEISNVYNLPKNLKYLNLSFNKIENIDKLPSELEVFIILNNKLKKLPNLSDTMTYLAFGYNYITKIDMLPKKLQELHCYYNLLNELPNIPQNLKSLQCYGNKLKWLPYIPESVSRLNCHLNEFPELIKFQRDDLSRKIFINKIYNFRNLFYSLKLKNKFIKWLKKIRKNKNKNNCQII